MSCLNSARCRYSYRKYETKRIQRKIERGGGAIKEAIKVGGRKKGWSVCKVGYIVARVGCIVTHTHAHKGEGEAKAHRVRTCTRDIC